MKAREDRLRRLARNDDKVFHKARRPFFEWGVRANYYLSDMTNTLVAVYADLDAAEGVEDRRYATFIESDHDLEKARMGIMIRNRPKYPMKAYKQQLQGARKRVVDPFLEKVTAIIARARKVHPRDESEPEKRLGTTFALFSNSIVRSALELRSVLRRRLDRSAMLRLGRSIGRLVDEEIGLAKLEFTPAPSACRKGCKFCCHLPVETTVPQILVIADHLTRTFQPSEVQDLRKRMDEY
jgi:hypothetical protein